MQRAHSNGTAVLALAVHVDETHGLLLASSGADGCLAVLRCESPGAPLQHFASNKLERAPLFSLLSVSGFLLAGTAARDVLRLRWSELAEGLPRVERACAGHTGWVRALSTDGRHVFSVGCNYVRCWDADTLEPLGQERLFAGDVLALASLDGATYSGGADGSLRAFVVDAAQRPALKLQQTVQNAHSDRLEALAVWSPTGSGGSQKLVSCGRDGALRVWHPDTLALEHEVLGAHGAGSRLQCLAAGSDGHLLSGGTDGRVRRWRLASSSGTLEAAGCSDSVYSAVRSLLSISTADGACCISGHQDGKIRVWQ